MLRGRNEPGAIYNIMTIHRILFMAALGGCSALASMGANAQAAAPQEAGSSGGLVEVVVTAQKRSETLLSVPISITALSQDTLDREGIKDLGDIARTTPALAITSNNPFGYSNVSIRGI